LLINTEVISEIIFLPLSFHLNLLLYVVHMCHI